MSVYDLYFAFGKPGTYFLDHTRNTCSQRMPDDYYSWKEDFPIQTMKSLTCDAEDNLFMAWETRQGGLRYGWVGISSYPELDEFLDEQGAANCRVTFGPTIGSYFVVNGNNGLRAWNNLSDQLHDVLNKSGRVQICALGIGGSYVIQCTDGSWNWACKVNYPELDKILASLDQGDVVFVALNRYRANEFFVALADGTVHIRASALVERHVLDILEEYPSITVITSDVVRSSKSLSTSRGGLFGRFRTNDFAKSIAKNVVGGIISATISATVTGCSVM